MRIARSLGLCKPQLHLPRQPLSSYYKQCTEAVEGHTNPSALLSGVHNEQDRHELFTPSQSILASYMIGEARWTLVVLPILYKFELYGLARDF